MAKARPTTKRRRIVIARPQEDKGDLQISAREAKLRLTPKHFLTMALLVAAAVAVVIVAKKYSGGPSVSPAPAVAALGRSADQTQQAPTVNHPPQVTGASIIPANPEASKPLDIKYEAVDQDGDPVSCTFRWFVNGNQVQEAHRAPFSPDHTAAVMLSSLR